MKKFLSLALYGLLLISPVSAARQDSVYTINSFEGGLNNHASPYLIKQNQASIFENCRTNTVYGALSKRNPLNTYGTAGSFPINGIHRYYKADGTKKLIAAGSTSLYVGTDSTGAFQEIRSGLSDGKKWQFVTYQDIAIGMNGFDNAQKYDGKTLITADTDAARTAGLVTADLGAPFAELNTGTTLDASAWYQYKVAFYDDATYSYSTAKSNPILTGAAVHNIYLTDIPIGPTGTTHRYIYRTVGDASQALVEADASYYRVTDIADNTTKVYADAISDATLLADAVPTWATASAGTNATPPKGSYPLIHKERLFISGNKTYLSDIYYSDEYNPQYFDPTDYRSIREDDGDAITFLREQLGIMVVGKTNTIQKFYTDNVTENSWYASAPFSFVGCPAPYSVANSPSGIYYLSRDGLWLFNGNGSQLISDAVTPVIRDILETQIENTWGYYWKGEYYLTYTASSTGATTNNRLLIYNTIRNSYTLDTKPVNCFGAFSSGTDYGTLYEGTSASTGYVYSEESPTPQLIQRLKSEFDLGTYADVKTYGTETAPVIQLAWDEITDNLTGITNNKSGITDRPATSGTWTSPIYQINATNLDLLYWNEFLNTYGDITWQIKCAATSGGIAGATFSTAVTNPNGSNLSGTAGNLYVQLRANFSTTDIAATPYLTVADGYVFKMTYSKIGAVGETSVLAKWQSGWTDFGSPAVRKFIHQIKVYYTGTSGTLTFNYINDDGDFTDTFTIDLSQDTTTNTKTYGDDPYKGVGTSKVFTYTPPANAPDMGSPIGQFFRFLITENGLKTWAIERLEVVYSVEPGDF